MAAPRARASNAGTVNPAPGPIHASRSRSKVTTGRPWAIASSAVRQNVS
jgi:hypothetical protein